jgi:hypothetical protein
MLPSLLYILTRRMLELVALRFRSGRPKVNRPGSDGGSGLPWVSWSRITGIMLLSTAGGSNGKTGLSA